MPFALPMGTALPAGESTYIAQVHLHTWQCCNVAHSGTWLWELFKATTIILWICCFNRQIKVLRNNKTSKSSVCMSFFFTSCHSKEDVFLFHLLVSMLGSRERNYAIFSHVPARDDVLWSVCICLSVRVALTYTASQVFLMHSSKRDKRNSSRKRPSMEVRHAAKKREEKKRIPAPSSPRRWLNIKAVLVTPSVTPCKPNFASSPYCKTFVSPFFHLILAFVCFAWGECFHSVFFCNSPYVSAFFFFCTWGWIGLMIDVFVFLNELIHTFGRDGENYVNDGMPAVHCCHSHLMSRVCSVAWLAASARHCHLPFFKIRLL